MAKFVLVHGAWGGGWYWARTARLLQAAGHDVFTPTLTGLGERSHLLTRDVGLETHIADILGVLKYEQLAEVVLVGHSYGGMVVSGVADRATDRIRTLVYLDAALPENGQAMSDLISAERFAMFVEAARARGDGWKIPPMPAEWWGIDNIEDRAWIDDYCGFHPLKTLTDKIALSGRHLTVRDKVFILASAYNPSPFQQFAKRTREDPAWTNYEIPTRHFTMVQMPRETADLLLQHI